MYQRGSLHFSGVSVSDNWCDLHQRSKIICLRNLKISARTQYYAQLLKIRTDFIRKMDKICKKQQLYIFENHIYSIFWDSILCWLRFEYSEGNWLEEAV
jgi:hypothetical protein